MNSEELIINNTKFALQILMEVSMSILEIKNLQTSYNGHVALENINFSIDEGEYVCLVGENGSGKSTLIKTIVGLHKKDSGEVILNEKLENVSYLAQNNLTDLDFPATAKEIIMTGVQRHRVLPFYKKKDYKDFEEICNLLKIKDFVNKRIGDLSGGQRQRIMLARALIRRPKMLILDEPFSGLDINITTELYELLAKLNKENKMTIIMATHDLDEVKEDNVRVIGLLKTVKFDGNITVWKGMN